MISRISSVGSHRLLERGAVQLISCWRRSPSHRLSERLLTRLSLDPTRPSHGGESLDINLQMIAVWLAKPFGGEFPKFDVTHVAFTPPLASDAKVQWGIASSRREGVFASPYQAGADLVRRRRGRGFL